jgi:hypothetical protein
MLIKLQGYQGIDSFVFKGYGHLVSIPCLFDRAINGTPSAGAISPNMTKGPPEFGDP